MMLSRDIGKARVKPSYSTLPTNRTPPLLYRLRIHLPPTAAIEAAATAREPEVAEAASELMQPLSP